MIFLTAAATFSLYLCASARGSDVVPSYTFRIEHRWGDSPTFVDRGTVIASPPSPSSSKPAASSSKPSAPGPPPLSHNLTASEVASMSRAVLTSIETGSPPPLYRVRVGGSASAAAPLCSVLRANFGEELILASSPFAGEDGAPFLLGVAYVPLPSPLAADVPCDEVARRHLRRAEEDGGHAGFRTVRSQVDLGDSVPGIPAVLSHAPILNPARLAAEKKKGKGRSAGEADAGPPHGIRFFSRGNQPPPSAARNAGGATGAGGGGKEEEEEPKSFFQKYWYILVPSLLIQLYGGLNPDQAPAQGAQPENAAGTQRQPLAGPAPAPAMSTGTTRQRRGKKD